MALSLGVGYERVCFDPKSRPDESGPNQPGKMPSSGRRDGYLENERSVLGNESSIRLAGRSGCEGASTHLFRVDQERPFLRAGTEVHCETARAPGRLGFCCHPRGATL